MQQKRMHPAIAQFIITNKTACTISTDRLTISMAPLSQVLIYDTTRIFISDCNRNLYKNVKSVGLDRYIKNM